jgi:hypothetical protein
MKAKKVLKSNNLPSRLPIFPTLSTGIALDYWNAPQWLWGALGFLFLIAWIAAIYQIATQESVDLLKNGDS